MSKLFVPILLIVGILFSVYLVLQNTNLFSKAAPDVTPRKVTISNISDSSFTVSWVTDNPTIGFVKYSTDSSLNQSEVDTREGSKARLTHSVSLKNLSSKQNYFFRIASGDQMFGDGQNNFQQTTAPVTEDTPLVPVLTFGKVKKKDGNIPQEAVVYLKLPDSTTLSTFIGDNGNYLFTITNARKVDLSSYISAKDGDSATVWAEAGDSGSLQSRQIKINNTQALEDLILEEPVKPKNAVENATWIKKLLNL